MELTAVYMKVPEGYIAFIEELPGANTQGETLDEARQNLNEAVALVLESNRTLAEQSLEGATVIRETFVLSPFTSIVWPASPHRFRATAR